MLSVSEMRKKVPIERVTHESQRCRGTRTRRACDTCRQRKMKCDGNRPMCTQCCSQELATCVYSGRKNEKERRQLELAKLKNENYEKLLRDISCEVEAPVAKKFASILEVCYWISLFWIASHYGLLR